jgi:DNA polymerase-1
MGNGIEKWGIPEVQARFEVERPEQVIDYLGMMGDAVDNIPGLPGVGDKTAKKFIKEYGSMENLLAHTHELKGKMKEKIEENKALGLLSKELATIMLDCPVEFHEKDFELNHPDFEKTSEIFKELEFRRIADSLPTIFKSFPTNGHQNTDEKTDISENVQPTAKQQESQQFDLFAVPKEETETTISGYQNLENSNQVYQYLNTPFSIKLALQKLVQQPSVAFHLELIDEDCFNAKISGISFSYEAGKGYFVVVEENSQEELLNEFKSFFENESIEKITNNGKHFIKVLQQFNIQLKGNLFDTTLAHYLLHPDMRHDSNVLAETYLNYQPQTLESLIGKKGKNQLLITDIDLEKQANFTIETADITFQLKQLFAIELEKNNLTKLYHEIEIPLLRVLAAMELEGIRLDNDFLDSLAENLINDIQNLENTIYKEAAIEFNLASPKQLGDVLFEHLNLVSKPKKTKTGQYATGEEILSKLAPKHQIVQDILDWRSLVKLKNTYVDALPKEVNPSTGRIHTTYSQTVATTGRLSSNNPNLQNIPIRTERGRQVRKAFVPRNENYTLVAADYSQIELRIIAALSEDESMIESFQRGEDIHAATAAKVFNVPLNEVTREQRGDAKAVNFGIIYGQGAYTLAQQLNKSTAEAKELIDNYYKTFPKLREFIANQIDEARENGFVETILHRRRYLTNINSQNAIVRSADERNAVNAPIQGSAADIIKIAMIKIQKLLEEGNYQSKMLLQVHDELVFDMHHSELETLKPIIQKTMETAFKLSVPLTVDLGEGKNWLEAH